MLKNSIQIKTGKDIVPQELATLMLATGQVESCSSEEAERLIKAYPFTIQARNLSGDLVGYLSAFSDGVFSTMINILLVDPRHQTYGIGVALLRKLEQRYPSVPISTHCFPEQRALFFAEGYSEPEYHRCLLTKPDSSHREHTLIEFKNGTLRT